ncbi:MAG: ABC transporter permease [bacterium]|nr:ABC transporter permease [bacterium]
MTIIEGALEGFSHCEDHRVGFHVEHESNIFRLRITGEWTIREVAQLQREIDAILMPSTLFSDHVGEIELGGLSKLDVAGAWLINSTRKKWSKRGLKTRFAGAGSEHHILIDEVRRSDKAGQPQQRQKSPFQRSLDDALKGIGGIGSDAMMILGFLGTIAATFTHSLVHPKRFRWVAFVHQLEHVGFRAIGIVSLICFLIGAVILQQGVVQLSYYGAEPLAVNMLAVLSLREVGVLLTAIIVAGRSGSAFTAEIGSMKMREEIDAMRIIGLDPIEVLVLPRVLALVVMVPLLAFWGDLMCMLGGAMMASFYLGLDWSGYVDNLHASVTMNHFLAGMIKAPFVALIIGIVGCMEGFKVEGSAESLGYHVTVAVVKAIFLVIIVDAVFAMFLASIGF